MPRVTEQPAADDGDDREELQPRFDLLCAVQQLVPTFVSAADRGVRVIARAMPRVPDQPPGRVDELWSDVTQICTIAARVLLCAIQFIVTILALFMRFAHYAFGMGIAAYLFVDAIRRLDATVRALEGVSVQLCGNL